MPNTTTAVFIVRKRELWGPIPWGGSFTGIVGDDVSETMFSKLTAKGWTIFREWDVYERRSNVTRFSVEVAR